nr:hypothetical protein [Micromonospora sp. DSM 115978]
MKFMLLIYSNAAAWDAMPEAECRGVVAEVDAIMRELGDSGEVVGGEVLADPSQTRAVRVRDGVPAVTDGPFPSGVAAGSLTEAMRWAEYRGRSRDVVVTYTGRASWQNITRPWIGMDAEHFRNFSGDWVISQPLFPESGPEKGNLADCAAGEYDGYWRSFGRWLVDQGRGDTFVRLGWEFNGLWFAWA